MQQSEGYKTSFVPNPYPVWPLKAKDHVPCSFIVAQPQGLGKMVHSVHLLHFLNSGLPAPPMSFFSLPPKKGKKNKPHMLVNLSKTEKISIGTWICIRASLMMPTTFSGSFTSRRRGLLVLPVSWSVGHLPELPINQPPAPRARPEPCLLLGARLPP